jgi:hypothetical protein
MTEQTSPVLSLTPADQEASATPRSPSGFGGRTDAQVGMSLGLAPPGLGSSRQVADDSAPTSLGAPTEGGEVFQASVAQQMQRPAPRPKEHAFKKLMREQAEAAKAAKTSDPIVDADEIQDAEVVDASTTTRDADPVDVVTDGDASGQAAAS